MTDEEKREKAFIDWWLANADKAIKDANNGSEMFVARRLARTAWMAAKKSKDV